jgi:predicted O-methyltransferase YrrM
MKTFEEIEKDACTIWGQVWGDERLELYQQAHKVPANGRIVEIGSLYGHSTAVLALAAPDAKILSIDNWSYHPEPTMIASPEENTKRLAALGISNVEFNTADSLQLGRPIYPIDLLWIDAGHEYLYICHDIFTYGPEAKAIICHDYNTEFPGVTQAVDEFIAAHQDYYIDHTTGSVVVIYRRE